MNDRLAGRGAGPFPGGEAILDVYGTDFDVAAKEDRSPLTEADLRAHRVIVDGLAA